jgi:hypothetical protein
MVAKKKKKPTARGDDLFSVKKKKRIPFDFVLDELASADPETKPMFGCTAVYIREKIVLILRDKPAKNTDNGVWLATTMDRHDSLRQDFPSMRSIAVLGGGVTGWQVLPADASDFEESVQKACALILRGDPRIGKVPASKRRATRG